MNIFKTLEISESINGPNIIDHVYPIGSIYCTDLNDFDPNIYWENTVWERFAKGRILVGLDGNNKLFNETGNIGGAVSHTLTIEEMPSHTHDQYVTANNGTAGVRADFRGDSGPYNTYYQCQCGSTGSGYEHQNMMPYITKNYWIRTA